MEVDEAHDDDLVVDLVLVVRRSGDLVDDRLVDEVHEGDGK